MDKGKEPWERAERNKERLLTAEMDWVKTMLSIVKTAAH